MDRFFLGRFVLFRHFDGRMTIVVIQNMGEILTFDWMSCCRPEVNSIEATF